MENSLKSFVDASNSVLVLLPNNPQFDEVAAGLAFYLAFKPQKPVLVVSPSEMTVAFNRLIGVNKIVREFGNKNLTIRFVNYSPEGIDKVSYDIENGEFRLTVIPKPGVAAPDEGKIQISYAGVAMDTVVLIGGAKESDFALLASEDLKEAKIIHLGTHSFESASGRVISLARPAASLSELTATLIKESGVNLDADMATNLLMGVEEETKHFTSREVTADTFALVAELMRQGGSRLPKEEETQETGFVASSTKAPRSWLEPKIYKGTSIS